MRMAIRKMVEADPEITVVGEARNGLVALAMIEDAKPDIVTMDVEMPEMDGLTATKEIMARFPRPIIMISSLTEQGAETTIKALAAGAADFISKKSSFVQLDIVQIGQELLEKIHLWYARRLSISVARRVSTQAASLPLDLPRRVLPGGPVGLVVIGLSTGGPAVLPGVLKEMGRLSCPVVVAQHMPQMFTNSFAAHLRSDTGLNVVEGTHAMALEPGLIVIAPGGTDCVIREPFPGKFSLALKLRAEMPIHPSVDALFMSASGVSVYVVAAILTGMGDDGTRGALALVQAKKNTPVLVQEFTSCVVDGMPSAAVKAGAATEILPPEQIGQRLKRWAG